MKPALFSFVVILVMVLGFDSRAFAQDSKIGIPAKCSGPIYNPKEVTFRPRISSKPTPEFTAEARAHAIRGRVVLSAVFCVTGKITDVQVIESLPFGMTEQAIKAAREIKFEPARKDGRHVSQVIRLEYNFGHVDEKGQPAQEPTAGRLIDTIEINGLRSKPTREIMALLKTRPGEPVHYEQVNDDLLSLLSLGLFDRMTSRVLLEESGRGGIKVVFELTEIPPRQ